MESLRGYDSWLQPKDGPSKSECDGCREMFYNEDLNQIDGLYLCEDCWCDYETECICCQKMTEVTMTEVIVNSLGNPERYCPECAKRERADQAYKIARIEGISSADFGPEMDDDRPVIAVDQTIELGSLPF